MDFRAGRWGDTPGEILRRESEEGFRPATDEPQPESDRVMFLFPDMPIMTYRCDVVYLFSSGTEAGLVAGEYRFHQFTKGLKKQLTVTLESKYGRAIETSPDRQVYDTSRTRVILDLKEGRLIHEKKK